VLAPDREHLCIALRTDLFIQNNCLLGAPKRNDLFIWNICVFWGAPRNDHDIVLYCEESMTIDGSVPSVCDI